MGTVTVDVAELIHRLGELRPDILAAYACALERLVIAVEKSAEARTELARHFTPKRSVAN